MCIVTVKAAVVELARVTVAEQALMMIPANGTAIPVKVAEVILAPVAEMKVASTTPLPL